MAVWDSSDDADIPYTAVDAGTDTLTLPANRKLLIWTGKTFEPNGNITLAGAELGLIMTVLLRLRLTQPLKPKVRKATVWVVVSYLEPTQSLQPLVQL